VLCAEAPDSDDADSLGGSICSASVPTGLYVWKEGLMPEIESCWKLYESCLGISEKAFTGAYESMDVKAALKDPSK
jgi:hypothetical protein